MVHPVADSDVATWTPPRLVSRELAIVRFRRFDRTMLHVVSDGLYRTGSDGRPLKFSHQEWARKLANTLGGFDSTSVWHHFFGLALLVLGIIQAVRGFIDLGMQRREG